MSRQNKHLKEVVASFSDSLEMGQAELNKLGIDYRVIGSVAAAAYLNFDLDFERPYVVSADKSKPDIDIVVPREDLRGAWEIRKKLLYQKYPVKMGLAIPYSNFDFRQHDEYSYLTHGDSLRVPVASKLFAPVVKEFLDTKIKTISSGTLLHTYGTFGGQIRSKDINKVNGLTSIAEQSGEIEANNYEAFAEFIIARNALISHEKPHYDIRKHAKVLPTKIAHTLQTPLVKRVSKAA